MSSKACRYECGTMITWDARNKIFKEQDGTPHTKERCGSLKEKVGKTPVPFGAKVETTPGKDVGMKEVVAALLGIAAAIRSRPA